MYIVFHRQTLGRHTGCTVVVEGQMAHRHNSNSRITKLHTAVSTCTSHSRVLLKGPRRLSLHPSYGLWYPNRDSKMCRKLSKFNEFSIRHAVKDCLIQVYPSGPSNPLQSLLSLSSALHNSYLLNNYINILYCMYIYHVGRVACYCILLYFHIHLFSHSRYNFIINFAFLHKGMLVTCVLQSTYCCCDVHSFMSSLVLH